jgi:hypothetical protein
MNAIFQTPFSYFCVYVVVHSDCAHVARLIWSLLLHDDLDSTVSLTYSARETSHPMLRKRMDLQQ